MLDWQRALREFIAPFRGQRNVIGALVCGSYVTGAPSPRSDIDVVIVLAPRSSFRERGNRVVGGHLVEYFANSPSQFRTYMKRDHARHRRDTATMFTTGRVIFDGRGAVRSLRAHARHWLTRPMRALSRSEIALEKYAVWDSLDNLRDLDERDSPAFAHAYHHHVQDIYEVYARYLRQPVLRPRQLHAYLTDARSRRKYLLTAFPDRRVAALLVAALVVRDRRAMRRAAEALTAHVTAQLGGFAVDGFTLRTPPSV
jgi:hypothetical protein